jgi:hypothetical protein
MLQSIDINVMSHEPGNLGGSFPSILFAAGASFPGFPERGLAFDAALDQYTYFKRRIAGYGTGNLTLNLLWWADSASSGNVRWSGALAALTPGVDTQDVTTDTMATETVVTAAHLGTVGRRMHLTSIVLTNLDSLANGDRLSLRVGRLGFSDGADTMAGLAVLSGLELTYSDT